MNMAMEKGRAIKVGILAGIIVSIFAVMMYTRADLAQRAFDLVADGDAEPAMGDAAGGAPPPLLYSVVYHEVANNVRREPAVKCTAALVVDNRSGSILYAKNEHEPRAIASLTKLMTAMVYLDCGPDFAQLVTITKEDAENSTRSSLRPGETFTVLDLLYAALVSSDNRAARAISRASGKTTDEFVRLMNDKALALGLKSTFFEEVTGLSPNNVSTAYEYALLLNTALGYDLIHRITTTPKYRYRSVNKKRLHQANNSNRLVFSKLRITGGKTGYIIPSGWCVATRAEDDAGHDITAVILGARSIGQRFRDADRAIRWGFENGG